jgi:hypothetical protein
LDGALIEVSATQGLGTGESEALAKTLIVPRAVRECVRDLLDSDEVIRLNHRAADTYFGPNWSTGTFKFPTAYKFDEPHCRSADIANANTIIIRLLREAISLDDAQQISRILGLADFYLRALAEGSHYHSSMIFCDDFVPIIPQSGFDEKRALIRAKQAQSLRMMGEREKCKAIILEIVSYPFPALTQQSIFIDLALCHQSLGEDEEAREVAEKIVKLDRHSNLGLQARALLIELEDEGPMRAQKLARFETLCRKEGAEIVANNIALLRADEADDDPDAVREILLPVVRAPRDKSDFYNKTRAAVRLAEISLDGGGKLSESELHYLVGSYHFLFNERLPGLFDQCHNSLWRTFEMTGDTVNLLTLFRHSSLYWRLRGKDSQEKGYLKKLTKRIGTTISEKVSNLSREAAYYLVRATAQALLGDSRANVKTAMSSTDASAPQGSSDVDMSH